VAAKVKVASANRPVPPLETWLPTTVLWMPSAANATEPVEAPTRETAGGSFAACRRLYFGWLRAEERVLRGS
jgi:hypothetical protein